MTDKTLDTLAELLQAPLNLGLSTRSMGYTEDLYRNSFDEWYESFLPARFMDEAFPEEWVIESFSFVKESDCFLCIFEKVEIDSKSEDLSFKID